MESRKATKPFRLVVRDLKRCEEKEARVSSRFAPPSVEEQDQLEAATAGLSPEEKLLWTTCGVVFPPVNDTERHRYAYCFDGSEGVGQTNPDANGSLLKLGKSSLTTTGQIFRFNTPNYDTKTGTFGRDRSSKSPSPPTRKEKIAACSVRLPRSPRSASNSPRNTSRTSNLSPRVSRLTPRRQEVERKPSAFMPSSPRWSPSPTARKGVVETLAAEHLPAMATTRSPSPQSPARRHSSISPLVLGQTLLSVDEKAKRGEPAISAAMRVAERVVQKRQAGMMRRYSM